MKITHSSQKLAISLTALYAALLLLPIVEAQRQQDNRALSMQGIKEFPAKAKRHALVIGIDEYQDEQISRLSVATNDAKVLADALVRYAGFPSDQVILLASDQPQQRQPNRGNILQYLSNLRGVVPDDGLLVFSFAGHGIERGGRAFLCPSDARIGGSMALLESTGVAVDTVREWIRETGVRQVLIILNACRNDSSGRAGNDPSGRGGEENRLTDSLAQRFNFDVRNKEVSAFATLYAADVGQLAYEYKEKKQGYFTWLLVEGMKGGAANEKGEVTLGALVKYLQEQVPKRVRLDMGQEKVQRPYATVAGYKADELVISISGRVPPVTPTVSALDSAADVWRKMRKKDTTPPKIVITSPLISRGLGIKPSDGTTVKQSASRITVTGRATDESGVSEAKVRDVVTLLDERGSFSADVPLGFGDNEIAVTATDVFGNRATERFTVRREREIAAQPPAAVISGQYHAVLIGVQDYEYKGVNKLEYPLDDAQKLERELTTRYTFEPRNVTVLKNPDRQTILNVLNQIAERLAPEDHLLIFYAGHGYWDEQRYQGYWLPRDAQRESRANWVSNSDLRDEMRGIKAKHILLVSDACFSGGILVTREAFGADSAAIVELDKLPSRTAMTSGALTTVPDRSVFVRYLLQRLSENNQAYLLGAELFSSLRLAVINNSPLQRNNSRPTPRYGTIQEVGDEGGDFIFVRRR